MSIIGTTIRILREAAGISRADFAKAIEKTYNYLSMIENGQAEPSSKLLEIIAKELKIPVPLLKWQDYENDTSGNPKLERIKQDLGDLFWEFIKLNLMEQGKNKIKIPRRSIKDK